MSGSIPGSPGEAKLAKVKADVSKGMGLPSTWQIWGLESRKWLSSNQNSQEVLRLL